MTQNQTPVEIELSQSEFDTIEVAATACDQTVEQFLTAAPARPKPRVVLAPAIAVPGFPFFKPVGQGAM